MAERALKPGWTWVKFGDVVRLNRDRCADPETEGIERYVGIEHIEPEDLRIRSWGLVEEGTTFTNYFQPGQVLFVKRRAYQRKVAVADFDGVCSGDIYVLEPKDDRLLSELLPFICQTERFFAHAVNTSAGSLSPRTNWTKLSQYEFALPPLEEQRRIVATLMAYYSSYEYTESAIHSGRTLLQSLTDAHLRGEHKRRRTNTRLGLIPSGWQIVQLGQLFQLTQYGLSIAPQSEGDYPLIRMTNVEDGLVVEGDLKYVNLPEKDFQTYRLRYGDVLFNRTNSYELVGRTGLYRLDGSHVFASYLVRVRTDTERLLPEYLVAYLNSSIGRQQVMSFATRGVSQTNVNASNLGRVSIPLPSPSEQQEIIAELATLRGGIRSLETRRDQAFLVNNELKHKLLKGGVS